MIEARLRNAVHLVSMASPQASPARIARPIDRRSHEVANKASEVSPRARQGTSSIRLMLGKIAGERKVIQSRGTSRPLANRRKTQKSEQVSRRLIGRNQTFQRK